ncbi:DEAD box protein-box ATP-dependent RNA helicase 37 [Aphelenchoides avenae]|nr:DEAD box protein-box ATP-dependent RNA helicase 37 [Aphelenchus avenae]
MDRDAKTTSADHGTRGGAAITPSTGNAAVAASSDYVYPSDWTDDDPYDEWESWRAEHYFRTGNWIGYDGPDEVSVVIVDNINGVIMTGGGARTPKKFLDWAEAKFNRALMNNIHSRYADGPLPLQQYVIPAIIDGCDLKCEAPSGCGKTAAFLMPIVNWIHKKKQEAKLAPRSSPYALILVPTRELCKQLYDEAVEFARMTAVNVTKACGGDYVCVNLAEILSGCDILIATVGRLKHFIAMEYVSLRELHFFVLDEADSLLSDDFLVDVRELVSLDGFPDAMNRQTLLFSATFPPYVQLVCDELLRADYTTITLGGSASTTAVGPARCVMQRVLEVRLEEKYFRLFQLLEDELARARASDGNGDKPQVRRTLIFVRTKRDATSMNRLLTERGFSASTVHADLTQADRTCALQLFNEGRLRIVVATDVLARGLELRDVAHIINVDLPLDFAVYLHRMGRLGRHHNNSITSFFDPNDGGDRKMASALVEELQRANQDVPEFLVAVAREEMSSGPSDAESGTEYNVSGANARPPWTNTSEE